MKEKTTAVFLDHASVNQSDLDLSALEKQLPVLEIFDSTQPEQTLERVSNARVVITNKVVLDASALQTCKSLELIVVAATGTNNIDLETARRNGVTVCNARNYATSSVAQHCMALILALSRNLLPYREAVQNGHWNESPFFCLLDHTIEDLDGKTLGIVGYGVLGNAVAELGRAFGMNILIGARPGAPVSAGRVSLETLYSQSDVISLHCPLTDQTRNLIGEHELGLMQQHTLLVNTARGGIVDEHALAAALRDNRIGGAGFDVLCVEPPDGSSPLLAWELPNLIVTPHNAWASRRCRQRLINQITEILVGWRSGNVINRVV